MTYTLGLDIGIQSVGFCLLDTEKQKIVTLGVRLFDRAETPKEGKSLAAARREARGTRTRIQRRAERLKKIRQLFLQQQLLTTTEIEHLFDLPNQTPYVLRAEGLARRLTPKEWARVLYHIAKHRGFKSNRKSEQSDAEKAKETGLVLASLKKNQELLQQKGYRTLGEMLQKDEAFSKNKRNKGGNYSHTLSRDLLAEEVKKLFEAQREQANPHSGNDFEQAFLSAFLFQNPVLSPEELLEKVGYCPLEKEEKRAHKSSYTAERFRLYQSINNLRIDHKGKTYDLTPSERYSIAKLAYEKNKVTYEQIRKELHFEGDLSWQFLYLPTKKGDSEPESATFIELKAFHTVRKVIENAVSKVYWSDIKHRETLLNQVTFALTCCKDDDTLREQLVASGIHANALDPLLAISFAGFAGYSIKAMQKLLPFLEAGQNDYAARQSAGYSGNIFTTAQTGDRLPVVDVEGIRNPVVARAVSQTRKVVNAIIAQYGMPQTIHVELARDIKKSHQEREEIKKMQNENQAESERLRLDFQTTFDHPPTGHDLLKYRLWKEQGGYCIYSGEYLDPQSVFLSGKESAAEVDHIIPYSISLNDSFLNKVLVKTSENRNKQNKTPYQYLGGDEDRWREFVKRVGTSTLSKIKRHFLLKEQLKPEDVQAMQERSLTDTRYISKYVAQYLEQNLAFPNPENKSPVRRVNGSVTAFLRKRWGLSKDRQENDLHHAQDAAVVASVSQWMVTEISNYASQQEENKYALEANPRHFPQPWKNFRNELKARLSVNPKEELKRLNLSTYSDEEIENIKPVFVSKRVCRKVTGAAHEQTVRSVKYLEKGRTCLRVSLNQLKLKTLENMVGRERDWRLYEALKKRLEDFGDKPQQAFATPFYKPTDEGKVAPIVRSVKILSTDGVSGVLVRDGIAKNERMVRIDIYSKNNCFYIVPIYVDDIAKKQPKTRAIVQRKVEDFWIQLDSSYQFLFSLHKNDLIRVVKSKGEELFGYYITCDRSTASIEMEVYEQGAKKSERGIGIKTSQLVEKYTVDMLGNYYKVDREKPPYELA